MKKILIATDLTPAAQGAMEYGMSLAEAFRAEVVLMSAFEEVPIPVVSVPNMMEVEDMEEYVRRQLEEEAQPWLRDKRVNVKISSYKGGAVSGILRAAHECGAELIVAGMKTEGKGVRKLLGDTVTALARKTDIPLLVVPEGVVFSAPKGIAIASDVFVEREYGLPTPVRQMEEQFHCKVFIIRIFNKNMGEVIEILHRSASSGHMIGAFSPLYELPASDTVVNSLNDFIDVSPIDWLVMKPHPRAMPEKWFLRSHTRQMIFLTHVPLLILPGDVIKTS